MRQGTALWLRQAQEDLITAQVNLDGGRFYAASIFSQQAAEKALKALSGFHQRGSSQESHSGCGGNSTMGKTKTRDAVLEDFIQKLRHKYHISELILFGSRAGDRADKESDYDLIVVSADFQGVEFTERIRAMYKLWSSDAGIDILCYTPQEFARKASQIGLVSDATKTGIKLLV